MREWREKRKTIRERISDVDEGSREQKKMIREVENCEDSGSQNP